MDLLPAKLVGAEVSGRGKKARDGCWLSDQRRGLHYISMRYYCIFIGVEKRPYTLVGSRFIGMETYCIKETANNQPCTNHTLIAMSPHHSKMPLLVEKTKPLALKLQVPFQSWLLNL